MPTLNRSYGVALVLLVLVCGFVRCKTPGGPFVTVNIIGIPKETSKLVMTATLGEMNHTIDTVPSVTSVPLTINMPPGARGPLVVVAQASVKDTSCMLAAGTVTVELADDIAYDAVLPLVETSLEGCQNVPTVTTVKVKLTKVESGGIGSVTSNPAGILCASECTVQEGSFRPGSPVSLIARPASGSKVTWTGATCGDSRVCTVTATAGTAVTATFTPCAQAWCDEGSPDVTSSLNAVWGSSNTAVYAVGDGGSILGRTANRWDAMTSGVTTSLRTVGHETGVTTPYAGGDSGTLLQLNGASWSPVALPAAIKGKQITSFTADRLSNTFLFLCTGDGGFFFKTNDADWAAITNGGLTGKSLRGIAATNNGIGREATVVGSGGVVVHWGQNFFVTRTAADNTNATVTAETLNGVWSGSGVSVAVGDKGTVITRGTGDYDNNNRLWTKVDSMVTNRLNAVWGGNDDNVWIVGDGGVILKYDNSKKMITKETNVPNIDLYGVWAADGTKTNVYAVGKNGTILHYVP